MTHFKSPTRSEVVHLYHIQQQGYHGIVLSDETAIGIDPFNVVQTIKQTIEWIYSWFIINLLRAASIIPTLI